MSLKDWLEEYKHDPDYIYEALCLDASYYLKELMLEKGLNKKQLAEKMGVSPAYITKIFSGENISLKTIAKVLSALEVDGKLVIKNKRKLKIYPNKKLFKKMETKDINESKMLVIAV